MDGSRDETLLQSMMRMSIFYGVPEVRIFGRATNHRDTRAGFIGCGSLRTQHRMVNPRFGRERCAFEKTVASP
jgi:hypothetical protein